MSWHVCETAVEFPGPGLSLAQTWLSKITFICKQIINSLKKKKKKKSERDSNSQCSNKQKPGAKKTRSQKIALGVPLVAERQALQSSRKPSRASPLVH